MQLIRLKKNLTNWRPLTVIAVLVASRVYSLLIFENSSIVNDSEVPIKIGGEPAFLDYALYTNNLSIAWAEINRPLEFLIFLIEDWHGVLLWLQAQPHKLGSIF
jgi:hypothetical protein